MPLGGSEEANVNDGALESPPARIWRKLARLPLHKEFINRIPNLILLNFGFPPRARVSFSSSRQLENTLLLGKVLLEASKAAKMAVWEAQPSRQRSEP